MGRSRGGLGNNLVSGASNDADNLSTALQSLSPEIEKFIAQIADIQQQVKSGRNLTTVFRDLTAATALLQRNATKAATQIKQNVSGSLSSAADIITKRSSQISSALDEVAETIAVLAKSGTASADDLQKVSASLNDVLGTTTASFSNIESEAAQANNALSFTNRNLLDMKGHLGGAKAAFNSLFNTGFKDVKGSVEGVGRSFSNLGQVIDNQQLSALGNQMGNLFDVVENGVKGIQDSKDILKKFKIGEAFTEALGGKKGDQQVKGSLKGVAGLVGSLGAMGIATAVLGSVISDFNSRAVKGGKALEDSLGVLEEFYRVQQTGTLTDVEQKKRQAERDIRTSTVFGNQLQKAKDASFAALQGGIGDPLARIAFFVGEGTQESLKKYNQKIQEQKDKLEEAAIAAGIWTAALDDPIIKQNTATEKDLENKKIGMDLQRQYNDLIEEGNSDALTKRLKQLKSEIELLQEHQGALEGMDKTNEKVIDDTRDTAKALEKLQQEEKDLTGGIGRQVQMRAKELAVLERDKTFRENAVVSITKQADAQTHFNELLRTATVSSVQDRIQAIVDESSALRDSFPLLQQRTILEQKLPKDQQAAVKALEESSNKYRDLVQEYTRLTTEVLPQAEERLRQDIAKKRDEFAEEDRKAAERKAIEDARRADDLRASQVKEQKQWDKERNQELTKFNDDRAKKIADFEETSTKELIAQQTERQKALDDFNLEQTRNAQDHFHRLEEIERDARTSILDAAANLDARGVLQAQQSRKKSLDDENYQFETSRRRAQEDFDRGQREQQANAERERTERRAQFMISLDEEKKQFDMEREARAKERAERQKEEDEQRALEKKRAEEDRKAEEAERDKAREKEIAEMKKPLEELKKTTSQMVQTLSGANQQIWGNFAATASSALENLKRNLIASYNSAPSAPGNITNQPSPVASASIRSSTSLGASIANIAASYSAPPAVAKASTTPAAYNSLAEALRKINQSGKTRYLAEGGDFGANENLVVGEKEPEMLRFNRPGTAIPFSKMAGNTYMVNATIVLGDIGSRSNESVKQMMKTAMLEVLRTTNSPRARTGA